MLEITAIRHGITAWNQEKRIQGHTDIPLAAEGIRILQQYRIPEAWHQYPWFCSPLLRTQQTAQQLGLKVEPEPRLAEMNWGDWEGYTLAEMHQKYGDFFTETAAKGLDMQPPNGESPRLVQARLTQWIIRLATTLSPDSAKIGIVTHKGVIRALLSAASGWDMQSKSPVKFDYKAAQRFGWDSTQQRWHLLEANIQLLAEN